MTIFDSISYILFSKKTISINLDEETGFSPFLTNRWLSMYSTSIAKISNTVNKYIGIFSSKDEAFNFFVGVFPKVPLKRITYFKRNKENVESEKVDELKLLAKSKELSLREIKEYVELYKNLVKS